jgi:hypothetical protein
VVFCCIYPEFIAMASGWCMILWVIMQLDGPPDKMTEVWRGQWLRWKETGEAGKDEVPTKGPEEIPAERGRRARSASDEAIGA